MTNRTDNHPAIRAAGAGSSAEHDPLTGERRRLDPQRISSPETWSEEERRERLALLVRGRLKLRTS